MLNISNGQTGPRSKAGKDISKMNALKSGIFAKSPVLPFEDLKAYRRHIKSVKASLHPQNILQQTLAQEIADCLWRGSRLQLRASLKRDEVFAELTPIKLAHLMGIVDEHANYAPEFFVDPSRSFTKKQIRDVRVIWNQYQHLKKNVKGIANYQSVWRTYPELFAYLEIKLKHQGGLRPLFMANQQGLDLSWQGAPREIEKYLELFSHELWYTIHFNELRADIRQWMAIWYFIQTRHSKDQDQMDERIMKEHKTLIGYLESYHRLQKSQMEFESRMAPMNPIDPLAQCLGLVANGEASSHGDTASQKSAANDSGSTKNEMP